MVVVIVLLTIVVFVLVDLALRLALRKREEAKLRREREQALDSGLRLDFTDEVASLKRVEVENSKARILAVDDEPVVLESFRKILVLEGYSVDTVETAQEALGLVRKQDYDFVYTDLKMPGMDGLDLTKAVKHLRPDIDVVMITGYGTVESAVETMKHGAMDYVQKPFTADELAEFTRKLLIRRQDRLEKQAPPTVQLVTSFSGGSDAPNVINVPGGIYVSSEHTWVGVEMTGEARVGLDDFALKTLRDIDEIEFPHRGHRVRRGDELFTIRRGNRSLTFTSPLNGTISSVNHELSYHLELLWRRPFALGWICYVAPETLSADLSALKIGADNIDWYEREISRFRKQMKELTRTEMEVAPSGVAAEDKAKRDELIETDAAWRTFAAEFFPASHEPATT